MDDDDDDDDDDDRAISNKLTGGRRNEWHKYYIAYVHTFFGIKVNVKSSLCFN
jgi:hypothetical protein